jgi:hypothetical protein
VSVVAIGFDFGGRGIGRGLFVLVGLSSLGDIKSFANQSVDKVLYPNDELAATLIGERELTNLVVRNIVFDMLLYTRPDFLGGDCCEIGCG